jgi:hypothetical protein
MFLIEEDKLFFGAAVNYYDICWVYPLKIKEIIGLGQDKYNEFLSILCVDIRSIQKELKKSGIPDEQLPGSAFEYLFNQCKIDSTFLVKFQEALFTFIREKVHLSFEHNEIIIGNDFSEKRKRLDKTSFNDIQNILRAQNKLPVPEPIPENENPMARKFRLRREQVAEAKLKQAQKSGEVVSLMDSIAVLICFGIGISFDEIKDLTIYQFKSLLARAQAKYKYDLDIRMIAAGADPKKIKPKHWFGKID